MASSATREAAGAVDVILRDGGTLRLRPPTAADADALVAFFEHLSERSRYLRFHGVRAVGRPLVEDDLEPDWVERGALLGTLAGDEGGERVVALASWVRLRDPQAAEIGFAVADDEQGRGIGTRLLEQLALRGRESGIERFVADVLADNRAALGVFADAGFELAHELGGGEVELRFPIASTEGFRERVEARDHVAVSASLRPFFTPRSVAVIGASRRRGSIGGELFRNILAADFAGAAYPVNRSGEPVAGVRAYGSVEEIADPIDLAVICLPGAQVLDAAESALRGGVRALCVISAGFAESGASSGSDRPAASHASAQRIPSPPAFVTTATRRPRGSGCDENKAAASISSSSVRARSTPAWRNSASIAASDPASAAVCELAARAPAAVVPAFSARIGFRRATRRASRANLRGLPNDSR